MFHVLAVEANDLTNIERTAQWKISRKHLKVQLSGSSQIHLIKNTVLLLFQLLRKKTLKCPAKGRGSVGAIIKREGC